MNTVWQLLTVRERELLRMAYFQPTVIASTRVLHNMYTRLVLKSLMVKTPNGGFTITAIGQSVVEKAMKL